MAARFDEAASAVELSVTDTGHGIDDANLTRIFDPFFTTRDVGDGTGLGLSICYGIVRDHGGQIHVESRVQRGHDVLDPAAGADLTNRRGRRTRSWWRIRTGRARLHRRGAARLGLHRGVDRTNRRRPSARYRAGGLQALLVDRGVIAADLAGWSTARVGRRRGRHRWCCCRGRADESEIDRFGREQASAILAPPFQLRALRSAIRAVAKEYV